MNTQEVATKKTSLEAEITTALEAVKVLTPATPEFDEAYARYLGAKASLVKIPEELAAAKLSENADAIAQCGVQVSEAIVQLLDGLKVADLVGVPIKTLRFAIDDAGKPLTVFNPVTKIKATGGKRTPGTGRTVVVDAEGNRLSLTKFVLAHATDAEKASLDYKYPHSRVDSKPKFETFCQEHSLTGYTYETATAESESTS